MSEQFNITKYLNKRPDGRKRFGNNGRMVHLFNYLELEQVGLVRGKESSQYQDMRANLVASNNPYLNVDITKINAAMGRDLLDHMDDLAAGNMSNALKPRTETQIQAEGANRYSVCPAR